VTDRPGAPVSPPPLALIAAVARNGVIGRRGQLPWDLPEDRAHFRRLTLGHAVIMGRRTWEERGTPLDGRRNLVVSRAAADTAPGAEVFASLRQAIVAARLTDPEPFVIGGARLYEEALPVATALHLTELAFDAEGDTWFPAFDRGVWHVVERRLGDRATYVTYARRSA
jgi:dihydrofolate reductase